MKKSITIAVLAITALTLSSPSLAQRREDLPRNQTGGIQGGIPNGVYKVVSVDSYSRMVQMQGADGSTINVHVGSGVYDVSKLNPGDTIQVNFLVPDGLSNKLSASNIWPVK